MSTSLEVAGLRKRYGEKAALDGADLTVRSGELLAILGPSGCGKSTLLKAITGLITLDGGEVRLGGRRIDALPTCDRGIGFLFQNYALFPHLTVEENIGFGLMLKRVDPAARRRRVESLLELVGLSGYGRKYPRQLSGGEQQRVALARALAPDPPVLLLDEPLSALDAQVRRHLRKELAILQETLGVTTLLVTHDQEEAFELGHRIAVMNAGRLAQVGPAEELYERPESEYVARFVGAVNLLEAQGDGAAWRVGRWPLRLGRAPGGTGGGAHRLMIRPEEIELLGPPAVLGELAETGGDVALNLLGCRVVTSLYLGTHLRVTLQTEDGQLLSAHVTKERAQELGLMPGMEMVVHLRQVRRFAQDGRSRHER